jgi:hypothetical protein
VLRAIERRSFKPVALCFKLEANLRRLLHADFRKF